jgi:flap endonuclease-1
MGVQISEIIPRKEITLSDLKGKIIAIDAFNAIYQFISTIRQPDGTPLQDHNKKITSHISGLFYRNINLLLEGIKPIYVFDGIPPELKYKEAEKRSETRQKAEEKYKDALDKEDVAEMGKYARQAVRITRDIIVESKELLDAMGLPVIQAKGEGEAEASFLSRNNKAWAAASQDFDALLFGAPRLVRNLTLARKRKTSSGAYVDINPELIEFETVLNRLGINKEQLICLAILVGTDYNPGGVRGIGQKRALEIVRQHEYPVKIFEYISKNPKYSMDFNWQEIFKEFHDYACCVNPEINFRKVDEERVRQILLSRDFSLDRINSGLQKLKDVQEKNKQRTLF